jgi:hypothetical protein
MTNGGDLCFDRLSMSVRKPPPDPHVARRLAPQDDTACGLRHFPGKSPLVPLYERSDSEGAILNFLQQAQGSRVGGWRQ